MMYLHHLGFLLRCCLYIATGFSSLPGLVLGAFDGCNQGELRLTETANNYDNKLGGKLTELLKGSGLKLGDARVFTNIGQEFYAIAVAGVGREGVGYNDLESLDVSKENTRIAAGVGSRYLQDEGVGAIFVEEFSSAEAAAEASGLAVWKYDDLKTTPQGPPTKVDLYSGDKDGWARGMFKADAQNMARKLEETPSNIMTPLAFTQATIDYLCACGIQVDVRDRDWIENKKMHAFLTTAKGSCEQPLFLEISYCGTSGEEKPVTIIGKGITFDTGGLCLKPCEGMSEYKGDLAGAAVVVGIMRAVAQLLLPINLVGLIPLCENMPGGMAIKPGDVVTAMNGTAIRLEDTDNEGRVILADTLCYSNQYEPCIIIDIGTFTPGLRKVMGGGCSGVFSTSDVIWRELKRAGADSGDRVWRFPFWKYFKKQVTDYVGVDINNVGKGDGCGSCLAAAFLKEFAPALDFAHLDITGTGMLASDDQYPYLRKGYMTGRPTRMLIQFFYQMACPHTKETEM